MKTVMYSHRYLSACGCKLLLYMLRDFVAAEGMASGHAAHHSPIASKGRVRGL